MYKTIASFALVAVVFGAVPFAHAQESGSETTTTSATSGTSNTVMSCMKTAVDTRESSINASLKEYQDAILGAYTQRAEEIGEAYGKSSNASLKTDLKNAWKNFQDEVKKAKTEWKKDRMAAWKKFQTDRKVCKSGSGMDDGSNQRLEVQ